MRKQLRGASAIAAMLALVACAADPAVRTPASDPSPSAQFDTIKARFDAAMHESRAASKAAQSDAERAHALANVLAFAGDVKALAKRHPDSPVVAEAIVWILQRNSGGDAVDALLDELLDVLLVHHLDNRVLADACKTIDGVPTPRSEQFLRAVEQRSGSVEARGWALYVLAKTVRNDANLVRRLDGGANVELLASVQQEFGAVRAEQLQRADAAALEREAEASLEQVVAQYGHLESYRTSLGEQARADLFELRHLSVGKPAPEITGKDLDGDAFELSAYRGKVVLLTFWGFW
jgi:hypothetical protein